MTLGFTVEDLVPAGRGGGALRMGLSCMDEDAWLFPHPDLDARRAAFRDHPDGVAILPRAEGAGREAAALLGVEGGLAEAAASVWEDLCILQPDAAGGHVLTGAAVAFPTDWRVADKIGLPVDQVHAPIHGYAEQLSAGVDHFLRTLAPGAIFGRTNWFVVPTASWRYLPQDDPVGRFAQVTVENAGNTLFVRCERQTLRRLPDSGAVLFTIGVAVERLDALSPAVVARVAADVLAQPGGEAERRASPHYADALAGYAALRSTDLEAAA